MHRVIDNHTRGRARSVGLVALLAVGLVVACVPESPSDPGPPASDLPAPTTYHFDDSVQLSWVVDGVPEGATYEWQWRQSGVQTWSNATTDDPTIELSAGLVPGGFHWARVRHVDQGGGAGQWSTGVRFFHADLTLPVVRIDTNDSAPIDRDEYVTAAMSIDPNGSADAPYVGTTEIRGRGNSTWGADKKPYRLKLASESELLGMPTNRHWVLLANAFDPSHLRNELAFQLSERTDLEWTPRFRFVEVVLNGRYDGIYMLGEHIRPGSSRVDIEEMEPTDVSGEELTGGYLLEFDFRLNTAVDPGFVASDGSIVAINEPDPPAPEQLNYVRNYYNAFLDAAWGPSFMDPVDGYRAYLDVDAFLDWYIVAELTRQQDGMWESTWFSKPRNGKLTFGPLWDFDLSLGALNDLTPGWGPDGWHINVPLIGRWVPQLFQDPALRTEARHRWNELRPAFEEVVAEIPTTAAEIAAARVTDAARWDVEPKSVDSDAYIANWLNSRIAWMSTHL